MPVEFDHKQFSICSPTLYLGDPENCNSAAGRRVVELVHTLALVGWDVPGITVKFRTTGQGQNLLRFVESITGVLEGEGPFKFGFGSSAGQRVGDWFVTSLPNDYTVPPGIHLHTYGDRSPDALARFKRPGSWASLTAVPYVPMSTDEDFSVESKPKGGGTTVAGPAIEYCVDKILRSLAALPDAPGCRDIDDKGHDANLRRLAHVDPEPVPDGFPPLYVWARSDDCYRIAGRHQDMTHNGPDRDYVLHGNGYRLLSLGTRVGDVAVSKRAFDGFEYGSTDLHSRVGHQSMGLSGSEQLPVEVKLRNLNDIFVVDGSRYEDVRKELAIASKAAGRDSFTDAEIDLMNVAVARTMVPASQYDGRVP